MPDQVRIGVVGTGRWADQMFLPVLAGCERVRLAAICGRNRARAEAMVAKYTIPQVFTDYRQMMEDGDLDAVVIATSDDTHYPMTMAAIDAGLHVLCDKPVALNAAHAREMVEAAEAAHLRHMVMYTWHWLPNMQRTKQMIEQGYLGQIYHASFQWLLGTARARDYQWRFDADCSNGIVSDLGSHPIHLAQWLIGDVSAVTARLGFHIQHNGLDGQPVKPANDSAWVALEFSSGAQAQIEVSAVSHWIRREKMESYLYGERGTIETGRTVGDDHHIYLRAGQEGGDILYDETPLDTIRYFQTQPVGPRLFVDSILDNQPITPGLYEGYKVQQVIDAALESHRNGCRVVLSPD